MRIAFPHPGYQDIPPIDVPDANLLGLYEPAALPEADEPATLRDGFQQPHDLPELRDDVDASDRVLIIFDDHTRITPVDRILPYVLEELRVARVRDDQIELLTSPGTHRPMNEQELKQKLGPYHGRFKLHQHDWQDPQQLHRFGETRDGTPVTANRLLHDSDFVLGIGSIVPHRVKGFGGGAKIAFPGVSGPEMMHRNQWEASMQMSETVMGVPDNPMRLRMEEAAGMVGLRYIVNVVLDRDRRVVGCYTGDPLVAFRAGCEQARRIYAAHMPWRADIGVIDAHPADLDLWQSAKGLYAATMAVREGGCIILIAPNPEGVATNHPNLMEIGYRPHADLVNLVQSGDVQDMVGIAILADIAQIVDKAHCILVSPGVEDHEARRLNLQPAATPDDALRLARDRLGDDASVAVFRHGGHILPLADETAVAAHLPGSTE